MNHYKWIVLKIQDLSTSEFVHSATYCNGETNDIETYAVSNEPIQYFVNSDDMEELLQAKEIMESACNSIYEAHVEVEETELDEDGFSYFKTKATPVYLDNFFVYNTKTRVLNRKEEIAQKKKQKKAPPYPFTNLQVKKIHKNRFQVIQTFEGNKPKLIEMYNDD